MTFALSAFGEIAFGEGDAVDSPPPPPPTTIGGGLFLLAAFGQVAFGALPTAPGTGFIMSPHRTSGTGSQDFQMTGSGTTWTGSNPFSIVQGGSFASIVAYSNLDAFRSVLTLNITSLGGTIVVADSNTGARYNIIAGAQAADAPGIGAITDNGNGTINVPYTPPVGNGGAAITEYEVRLNTGQTKRFTSSPAVMPATIGVATTANVYAVNANGTSSPSLTSNSITPARTVVSSFYVDSLTGDDQNTGLALDDAWQSLNRVNGFAHIGDDKYLLVPGSDRAYPGTLRIQSGTPGHPTFYSTPGRTVGAEVAASNRAVILCGDGIAIDFSDVQCYHVDNLFGQGSGVSQSTGNTTSSDMGSGIFGTATQATDMLVECLITACEVSGCCDAFSAWVAVGKKGWDGLRIVDPLAHDCQRNGVIHLTFPASFAEGTDDQSGTVQFIRPHVYNMPGKAGVNCGSGVNIRNAANGYVEDVCVHDINQLGYFTGFAGGTAGIGTAVTQLFVCNRWECWNIFAPNSSDGCPVNGESGAAMAIFMNGYGHDSDGAGMITGRVSGAGATHVVSINNVYARNCRNNESEIAAFNVDNGTYSFTSINDTIYATNSHAVDIQVTGTFRFFNTAFIAPNGKKNILGTPDEVEGCLYWRPNGTVDIDGSANLPTWQGRGFESNGSSHGVIADPLYIAPASGIGQGTLPTAPVGTMTYFDRLAASPATDAGFDVTAVGLTVPLTDFHGNARVQGGAIDIGHAESPVPANVQRAAYYLQGE